MLPAPVLSNIKQDILPSITGKHQSFDITAISGGSINQCYRLRLADGGNFFLKVNELSPYPALFEKEKEGLMALRPFFQTPAVLACNHVEGWQLLLMEWIDTGIRTDQFWKGFGERLAYLHSHKGERSGWTGNNYIGSLVQDNSSMDNWVDFFRERRLRPLVNNAAAAGLLHRSQQQSFEDLYDRLPSFFEDERPSLLHGDLWSGNFLCDRNSTSVLIDPAVYYGHPSMDLAMTTLFGGFDRRFYEAYHHHRPLPSNYREQWEICNLYPLLVHLHLFGESYLGSITATLDQYS